MFTGVLTRHPAAARPLRRAALLICAGCALAGFAARTLADTPAAPAACQGGTAPAPVQEARAALEHAPEQLGARLRLADALVDQGCYEDAVSVLEAGRSAHPRSGELAAKLRDVRSMLAEQAYIKGITEAADAAKLQHDQLRCTKLADLQACNEALQVRPGDASLLLAKADALVQIARLEEGIEIYRRLASSSPANESLQSKLAAALALQSATRAAAAMTDASRSSAAARTPRPPKASAGRPTLAAAAKSRPTQGAPLGVAAPPAGPAIALARQAAYSNAAPPGRSN